MNDGRLAISGDTAIGAGTGSSRTRVISESARTTAATSTPSSRLTSTPAHGGPVDRRGGPQPERGSGHYLGIYFWKNGNPSSIFLSGPAAY